uniref:Uncharacterized protein n=1 Tax=Arundo donax TaxID=35708 RepID=A0A0A9H958_ARUDO
MKQCGAQIFGEGRDGGPGDRAAAAGQSA